MAIFYGAIITVHCVKEAINVKFLDSTFEGNTGGPLIEIKSDETLVDLWYTTTEV